MPTPAKLVSAVLFAALAWYVADTIVRVALPEGTQVGRFREILAFMGLMIGWKYIGKTVMGAAGRGTSLPVAITSGIGGAAILLVLGLVLESFRKMITESLDRTYNEVGAAAGAWMKFLLEDGQTVANPIIMGTLFGGAVVVGILGGMVARVTR